MTGTDDTGGQKQESVLGYLDDLGKKPLALEAPKFEALTGNLDQIKVPYIAAVGPTGNINLEVFEAHRPTPEQIVASEHFASIESFIAYIKRYQASESLMIRILTSRESAAVRVSCSLNYHRSPDSPAWDRHYARLKIAMDDQFLLWASATCPKRKETFSHSEAVSIIRTARSTIAKPSYAVLAEQFQAVTATSTVKTDSLNASVKREARRNLQTTIDRQVPDSISICTRVIPGLAVKFEVDVYTDVSKDLEVEFSFRMHDRGLVYETIDSEMAKRLIAFNPHVYIAAENH